MVADAHGGDYEAIKSLHEAQARADAAIVMEGDYGGSIYLTCPARLVRCDEPALRQLLHDLDERDWDDPEGAALYYEVRTRRLGRRRGNGRWCRYRPHLASPDLEAKGLRERVEAVINGKRLRLD